MRWSETGKQEASTGTKNQPLLREPTTRTYTHARTHIVAHKIYMKVTDQKQHKIFALGLYLHVGGAVLPTTFLHHGSHTGVDIGPETFDLVVPLINVLLSLTWR